ncbi:MAG: hypothetical protein Q8M69_14775 [Reyranella sp.]|nr:hypothetical protein [Reyranella sp.]
MVDDKEPVVSTGAPQARSGETFFAPKAGYSQRVRSLRFASLREASVETTDLN